MFKKFNSFIVSQGKKALAVGTGLAVTTGIASADAGADITAAFTGAQTNVGVAVGGLIALAALVTGVGIIISLLRK
jgi:hypothetical protein